MKEEMRQRHNIRDNTGGDGKKQAGRHDEIEKLKDKGLIGGFLHVVTLLFNFYALISCVSAILDYIKGTHELEDVDLFKTVLPQFVAVLVGLITSALAMRVINKTYEDKLNICASSDQAHLCISQMLKSVFNTTIFILMYKFNYTFTVDELSAGGGIGIYFSLLLGFLLFVFIFSYRKFVLGEPHKYQKEKQMYNPYQAFVSNNRKLINMSFICKIIQTCIILPICDEMLFRMFFYHRIHGALFNNNIDASASGSSSYTPYINGSKNGNVLIAFVTALLFNAYSVDKKVDKQHYLLSIIPGVIKGFVLHLVLFTSQTTNNVNETNILNIGMGGNLINCIIIHSSCNFLLCLALIYNKQFWLWP